MAFNLELVRMLAPEREIAWYDTIDSTMYEAVRRANAGCASGTVVGADEQSAGHGRFGRTWHSVAGAGLYFSIVLRVPVKAAEIPVVTFALGLAVSQAIGSATGVACDLRWPNDVLAGGRKCAGILTQLHGEAVVAGIGINVNQIEFPSDVEGIATSLRLESGGREQAREPLLTAVLEEIDRHIEVLARQGSSAIFDLFTQASSYVSGRRVSVELPDGEVTGVTAGLTPEGYLLVKRDDGKLETIVAGGVRPAGA